MGQGRQGIQQGRQGELIEACQGHGLLQVKAQGPGAAQPGQGTTAAQGLPQVPGQGADVGAGRAGHLHLQGPAGGIPAQQFQAMHRHRPGCQFQLFPLAHPLVCPLAVYMHGRHLGRHLLDLAPESRQGRSEIPSLEGRHGGSGQHLPLEVVADGAHPQLHQSPVGLVPLQVGQQPGGGPQGERQHPGHGWIEGAAMAHPLEAIGPAHPAHTAMGGEARGLIEHQKAAGLVRHGWERQPCRVP